MMTSFMTNKGIYSILLKTRINPGIFNRKFTAVSDNTRHAMSKMSLDFGFSATSIKS